MTSAVGGEEAGAEGARVVIPAPFTCLFQPLLVPFLFCNISFVVVNIFRENSAKKDVY